MIGKTLNHYKVINKLGSGGMGEVYTAEDAKLDRKVALKILPREMAASTERLGRFEREAKAIAALNHPNIVHIYSIEKSGPGDGTTGEVNFLTMELVTGRPLGQVIPKGGLDLRRLLDLGLAMTEAMTAAHEKNITHRDLKPDNIMVGDDGRLKILDFGLAKLKGEAQPIQDATSLPTQAIQTEDGRILGTVAYMAPEQAEGKPVDSRTDVFAMGVLLYEMATGERPFKGDTKISVISSIMRDTPTSITDLNRNLPRHLGRIIKQCLAKNPERRYGNARELHNDLLELKEELDSGEILPTAATAGIGLTRRRRNWLGLAGVGLVIAGLGVVGVLAARYFLWPRGPETPAGPVSIRPLTSMAGIEGDPSWSPDGTFLTFSHFPGSVSLFVVPTAGGDPVPLVESEASDGSPRWSPDSRWIAFVSNRDGRSGIFLVPPLGGQVHRLADITMPLPFSGDEQGALGGIPWSPDGRTLLFSRQASDGSVAIWEIELNSRRETQLTHPEPGVHDLFASWSFDGSRIVFSRDGDLWLLTPRDHPQPLFKDQPVKGKWPTWMPDGNRILFQANRSGNADLWEIDAVSGSLRQITMSPGGDLQPAVSRDGRIAYMEFSHEQDLYVVSLEERSHERLTSHTGDNDDARISPDGAKIAYVSMRTGDWEIWVIDRATGNERRLASHPAADQFPTWSPDGKQVAFVSNRDGKAALWVVDLDGTGGPRRLTEEAIQIVPSNLRWSPDGAAIGFVAPSERGPALYELDLATGGVTPRIYNIEMFDWYLGRERVIYTPITRNSEGRMEMRVASLQTGKEDVLFEGFHTMAKVTRDGKAVAYCHGATHVAMQLYYLKLRPPSPDSTDGLPTPVGEPVQLTDGYGEYHIHNGGWSPDGKEIVYTRDIDAGDLYVIEPP